MTTRRKILQHWTETKKVIDGEVAQATCCCEAPGATRKGCAIVTGNKTPCRCDCHRTQGQDMKWTEKPLDSTPDKG